MSSVQDEFRATMSRFATGVTVVTTVEGDASYGATVNAFCSVSLDPPLVLISLDNASNTLARIRTGGVFAINVLTADQQHLARRFARKEVEGHKPFSDVPLRTGLTGAPLFAEALARIECCVTAEYPGGDHTLVLGEVAAIDGANAADETEPLTYYRSTFEPPSAEPVRLRAAVPAVDRASTR